MFKVAATRKHPLPSSYLSKLTTNLAAAYTATQAKPIVPETAYPGPYKGAKDTYSRIEDNYLTFTPIGATDVINSVTVTDGGSGYVTAPNVTISAPASGTQATATAVLTGDVVTAIQVTGGGSGYSGTPPATVTIDPPPSGTTATAVASLDLVKYMEPKAIQELFELNYGRMNATLGVELPFTNSTTQTTIPLGYMDPATEIINGSDAATPVGSLNDGTQIWKITHNGVDTHAIHFHLYNVQLINRVGWDGAIRPPDPNELGWKETVRMNPLEDAIVALRPVAPDIPFKVGDSIRPLDPTMPIGAPLTLTSPTDGNPVTVPNDLTDFGWEYVWHCHLLGHEENDMMRPQVMEFAPARAVRPHRAGSAGDADRPRVDRQRDRQPGGHQRRDRAGDGRGLHHGSDDVLRRPDGDRLLRHVRRRGDHLLLPREGGERSGVLRLVRRGDCDHAVTH